MLPSWLLNAKHTSGKYRMQAMLGRKINFFLARTIFVLFRYSTEGTHFIAVLNTEKMSSSALSIQNPVVHLLDEDCTVPLSIMSQRGQSRCTELAHGI